jgi:hypothetical protein
MINRYEVLFELLECLFRFLYLDEGSKLPQKLEEWESPLS